MLLKINSEIHIFEGEQFPLSSYRYLLHVVSNAWSNKKFKNGVKWTMWSTLPRADALTWTYFVLSGYATHYQAVAPLPAKYASRNCRRRTGQGSRDPRSMLEAVVAIRNREMNYPTAEKQFTLQKKKQLQFTNLNKRYWGLTEIRNTKIKHVWVFTLGLQYCLIGQ